MPGVVVSYQGGLVSPAGGPRPWPAEHRAATKAALRDTAQPAGPARHRAGAVRRAARRSGGRAARVRRRPGAAAAGPGRGRPPVWFEQLATEPDRRAVAGLGAEVVRNDQEDLMAAAWEHAAGLREVNRTLTGARFAWEVAQIADPAFASLDDATILQVARPAMGRLADPAGGTVRGAVAASALPADLLSGGLPARYPDRPGFHRDGPAAGRRDAAGRVDGGADHRGPGRPGRFRREVGGRVPAAGHRGRGRAARGPRPSGEPGAAREPWPAGGAVGDPGATRELGDVQRAASTGYDFPRPEIDLDHGVLYDGTTDSIPDLADSVRSGLDQAGTIVAMIETRVTGLPSDRDHDVPAGLTARPVFTTPMSQRLIALSAEYLVPGLGRVADNTLGLLQVQSRVPRSVPDRVQP